jgi:tetratricopeptide (TPR) repeat protein
MSIDSFDALFAEPLSSNPLFYLCTGFHRSGTSLVAQTLANNGVAMGNELMGASFSNPLGHVEDMPAVRLHDNIFAINGTDWRYADNGPLIKPNWLTNYIGRYINERQRTAELSGVKDPRAVYFLKDWHLAHPKDIRFVLVFRHWSTAVNSIFNRHSRHIINSAQRMEAHKVNMRFWQEPSLAFEMWWSSNQRILEFYRAHKDKCVLISQEGFVQQPTYLSEVATRIDLPTKAFDAPHYQPELMTDSVPSYVLAMADRDLRKKLDSLWQDLQTIADIPAPHVPKQVDAVTLNKSHFNLSDEAAKPTQAPAHTFDLSSLSWTEACGFLVRIPRQHLAPQLFESLLQRPFTSVDNYFTLAKLAHKHAYFLHTKLAKMRGMHVASSTWHIAAWQLYTEGKPDWIDCCDGDLPQVNPFSLRPTSDLAEGGDQDEILQCSPDTVIDILSGSQDVKREKLELVLLYRAFSDSQYFLKLAQFATQHGLFSHAEFCLIKALRLNNEPYTIMAIGDLYLRMGLTLQAHHCFAHAIAEQADAVPLLVRLADVNLALNHVNESLHFIAQAQQIQPDAAMVKKCALRIERFMAANQYKDVAPSGNKKQTISAEYVMPAVESYEEVVALLRHDEKAGEKLDDYNMRYAFMMRDNKAWLRHGLMQLSPPAATCLASKIVQHWSKIWPKSVLHSVLTLPDTYPSRIISPATTIDATLNIAVHWHIDSMRNVSQLIEYTRLLPQTCQVLVSGVDAQTESLLAQIADDFKNRLVVIQRPSSEGSSVDLNVLYQHLSQFDVVCMLRSTPQEDEAKPVNLLLQQLYSLLGSADIINHAVRAFAQDAKLAILCAPYHPAKLDRIGWLQDKPEVEALLDELPNPLILYPEGGLCWIRPGLLEPVFSQNKISFTSGVWPKLAAAYVNKMGYAIKVNRLI